jgi:uncharacterized protein DUF11
MAIRGGYRRVKKARSPVAACRRGLALVGAVFVLQGGCGSASTTTAPGSGLVDVAVVMVPSTNQARVGDTVSYVITVTNAGPDAARPVGFTTWLTSRDDPRAVAGSGWLCQLHTGNFVTCELAELGPRGSSALTMSRPAVEPGGLETTAEVAAWTDSTPGNNRVTVAVMVE